MKSLTNKRLRGIGLKNIFKNVPKPPSWITSFGESKNVQVAPQETEIISYKIGTYTQDIDKTDWQEKYADLI